VFVVPGYTVLYVFERIGVASIARSVLDFVVPAIGRERQNDIKQFEESGGVLYTPLTTHLMLQKQNNSYRWYMRNVGDF
jgi:hypothetical protein